MLSLLAWLFVLPIVVWAAVRLSGSERGFPLVALMAYTPYVGAAAVVLALALAAIRRRLPALVTAVAALALLAGVADRVVADEQIRDDGPRLRVLSANVARGSVEARVLTSMIRTRRVDLLSLQELTPELAAQLRRGPAGDMLPHAALRAGEGASGTGLMSRRRLTLRPMPGGLANRTAVAGTR